LLTGRQRTYRPPEDDEEELGTVLRSFPGFWLPGVVSFFLDDLESGVVCRSLPFLLLPGVFMWEPLLSAPVGCWLEPDEDDDEPEEDE